MAFAVSYLTDPAAFPARDDGECPGNTTLTADFAGGPYQFDGLTPHLRGCLADRFAGMGGAGNVEPAVLTRVYRLPGAFFRHVDTAGWDYALDMRHLPDRVELAGLGFVARLYPGEYPLRAYLWCSADDNDLVSVVENLFRILVAYRLLAQGGVLLHSAAVLDDGRAHVFFGHSTAGKTTISRISLASGRAVLSDDINAVHHDPRGSVLVSKMPFAGDLGQTATTGTWPVAGLYRLRKAATHALSPLPVAQAVAQLTACAPYVNADPHRAPRLLAVLEQLATVIPLQTLAFRPDTGVWDLLGRNTEALAS